ncbi:hypothetical protein EDD22DRAFT_849665 [Suillus occidentalis]|nr:hypothetical protein EDD22DRAFT_849665 [Suillus occidentalis]
MTMAKKVLNAAVFADELKMIQSSIIWKVDCRGQGEKVEAIERSTCWIVSCTFLSIAVTSGKEVLLKDFRVTNAEISPYDTEQVSITLSRYGLSIWDVAAQEWRKPDGQIVLVLYKYKK